MTKPGSDRKRLVNFFQADGQRLREFVTEILGCGRNPVGSYRTLIQLSRNREHRASDRHRQKPFRTKARNAKRPSADLSASGVNCLVCFVRRKTKSSPGRTRTYDPAVNSRLLYQLSYRGMNWSGYPMVENWTRPRGFGFAAANWVGGGPSG